MRRTVCVKCGCSKPFVNVSPCLTRVSVLCFMPLKRFLEFSRFTSCLTFLTFGPICTHILSSRESWDFVCGIHISASRCDWPTQFGSKPRSCRGLPNGLSFWVQLPQGDCGFLGHGGSPFGDPAECFFLRHFPQSFSSPFAYDLDDHLLPMWTKKTVRTGSAVT